MSVTTVARNSSLDTEVNAFVEDKATPRWIKDLFRFLPVKSQFLLSGNICDRYPFRENEDKYRPCNIVSYLSETMRLKGYEYFISFNRTQGFSVVVPAVYEVEDSMKFFKEKFKLEFNAVSGFFTCSMQKSLDIIEQMSGWRDNFIAVFTDFASRYVVRTDSISPDEHDYFSRALILSHTNMPHTTPTCKWSQFNPIIWLCDKENDLPGWFVLGNPRIRSIIVPKPDHFLRRALIRALTPALEGYNIADEKKGNDDFVEQTEGMVMTDVIAITQLCRRENLKFKDIGEAVRRYKLGVTEDPWKRIDHERIVNGEVFIRQRVKGQQAAVTKSLDIIKRAMTGLSGAQGSKVGGRPRGIMFLAGPTGTGKTELAKTITELLFQDEHAYIRFDMSEFSQEHTDQRLIGAPPGYIGSDMGGELTNAIKEKPFSVVLFDEIEKAHPRILDKFLQILDDGVLTSGRGERVYFSESVIVFTSNLGISRMENGARIPNVTTDDSYADVERKVRIEIDNYFKTQLGRPEILNRIGENIVVFDFIRDDVAVQIYDKMVKGILGRLKDTQHIDVSLEADINDALKTLCIRNLANGGRGIGNQLEAWLINPLARAIFDGNISPGACVRVVALEEFTGVPAIKIEQIEGAST